MLETIRAYALEKLEENSEARQAAPRQAEFFRNLVRPGLRTQPTVEELACQLREIDNVRAALDWSFSAHGDATIGVELTSGFIPVWTYYALMVEVRDRIERALEALDADPRGRSRLHLHAVLGMALLVTLGPAERSTTLLTGALVEAESCGDLDAQLQILYVLAVAYVNLSKADRSVLAIEQFARLAPRTGDTGTVIAANQMLGYTLHFRGVHTEAWQCCEQGLATSATWREQKSAIWFHATQPLFARAVMARILWLRGSVDQSVAEARTLLDEARALDNPVLRWSVLRGGVCSLAITSGDLATAQRALPMMTYPGQNPTWRNTARCLEGRLLIARGEFENGVTVLRNALETCDRTDWTGWYPEFLSALAEGLGSLGQLAEALAAVERAEAVAERGGECWYLPEVLRIKGELLIQDNGDGRVPAAQACFDRAMDVARQQSALSWELRAAVSLARLWVPHGREAEAKEVLAPVFARFTQGFDTADLRAARTLLEVLI